MITFAVGGFFLVLAAILGSAAGYEYFGAERKWTPAVKARARTACIFLLVGLGLIAWQISQSRKS